MRGGRAEVQRQLAEEHINEVIYLRRMMQSAVLNAEIRMGNSVQVDLQTAKRVIRNLEDLQKRFLEGTIEGGAEMYRTMRTTLGHKYRMRTAEDPTLEQILMGLAITVLPFAATVAMMLLWIKGV